MAMKNSDLMMPTYRNPGRLVVAETAEAGTDVSMRGLNGHVAEGYVVAYVSMEVARRKVAGVIARVYRCRGGNDVVSGAASGVGGSGMLKSTANGDRELEALNMITRNST